MTFEEFLKEINMAYAVDWSNKDMNIIRRGYNNYKKGKYDFKTAEDAVTETLRLLENHWQKEYERTHWWES